MTLRTAPRLAAPAGLLLTLGLEPDPRIVDLVQRLGSSLPVVSVDLDSYETVSRMTEMEGQLRADNVRKVQAALGAFESHVDGSQLAARLDITRSSRVTPMMFEYELISRARHVRRRVGMRPSRASARSVAPDLPSR